MRGTGSYRSRDGRSAGVRRLVRTLATLTFALLVLASPLGAALSGVIVPTGRQDYFVLGHEQHVWNMMQRVRSGEGGPAFQNGMNSVVSAVASADGQVVTYDHWEDAGGFEADPWNPVQASTLVLGDGNNANGRACDWTNDPRVAPCNGTNDDVLFRGSALTFNSDQGLASGGCALGVQCTVPLNPRGTALHFDGGDRLVTSGGPLSLIHNQFPPPYPQIGGSTEVLPRQAFTGATSYSIPAGEDLYVAGGPYQMFNYTSVNIVAFDDATQVFINSPGGGTASFTLNQGQHYTNCLTWNGGTFACNGGGIDGVAAPAVTINASTKISATGPIAILLFSGGDGTWATDFMPILPELLHGNDYILPSPGDDPAVLGNRPLNIYTYNPDPVNAISVSTADTVGTGTIAVPTEATIDYFAALGRYVPTNSTVRLTSNRSFWGLAIHDHLSPANDWGYSWLATDFLTRNYTVSYAPGISDPPGNWPTCGVSPVATPGLCDSLNRSAVFVAAALDFTLVKVDFDNDGLFDIIDRDSDDFPDPGVATDSSCAGGLNCLYRVDALQTLRIFDYTDYDNTGTRIQASKPIAVAYGQDTDQATGPDAILDTGYTVYPLSQRFLDPVLVVGKTVSPTVVPDTGGQATFTITAQSFSFTPLTSMTVTDLLPAGLVQADYVLGSTLITYPDLSQGTADPTFSIDPGGRTRLTWTLAPDTMGMDQALTVRFTLNIPAGRGPDLRQRGLRLRGLRRPHLQRGRRSGRGPHQRGPHQAGHRRRRPRARRRPHLHPPDRQQRARRRDQRGPHRPDSARDHLRHRQRHHPGAFLQRLRPGPERGGLDRGELRRRRLRHPHLPGPHQPRHRHRAGPRQHRDLRERHHPHVLLQRGVDHRRRPHPLRHQEPRRHAPPTVLHPNELVTFEVTIQTTAPAPPPTSPSPTLWPSPTPPTRRAPWR